MGAWGVGLYSSDFALDLRSSARAIARLPYEPNRLLELLCETDPAAANDPKDYDHTIFWLTAADQFAKRGIECARAREQALAIISDGSDLAAMASLGMDEKSLAKRRTMLAELEKRLRAPAVAGKARAVLKTPQKLLLEVGETLIYPICNGQPINPYLVGKDYAWVLDWKQDGWGAFVVVERGHVFDYLAWYRPLVIGSPVAVEPTWDDVRKPRLWIMRNPGTFSARHYGNMELKSLGRVSIDIGKLNSAFPTRMSPRSCAVSDISIANRMTIRGLGVHEDHRVRHGLPPAPRVNELAELAVEERGTIGARGAA